MAQYSLAQSYAHGRGVPRHYFVCVGLGVGLDDIEAVRWFRKAAEQGLADAQFLLGWAYYHGQGVPQDFAEAARWFRRAADQGDANAQYYLAFRYYNGQGVPRDCVRARMWIGLAAVHATGNLKQDCASGLDLLAREMTPDQIAEAERQAGEWKPHQEPGAANWRDTEW